MRLLHRLCLLGLISLSLPVLAGSYEVTDAFGKHRFETPPARVVVTDWTLLENLLELGITPIGAPELDGYRQYVKTPPLQEGIRDIGLRQAPSLKILESVQPDLIILGTGQKDLARPFSRISRVAYYKFFSDRYRTNGLKARERFLQMAELFQKTGLARQKLAEMDTKIANLRGRLPKVTGSITLARQAGDGKLILYGPNSLPGHALVLLGLQNTQDFKGNSWGEKEVAAASLRTEQNSTLILLDDAWPYGGALSLGHLAERICLKLTHSQL